MKVIMKRYIVAFILLNTMLLQADILFYYMAGVLPSIIMKVSKVSDIPVKKTGQTSSYNTDGNEVTDGSLKDDGFYQKGVTPNYTRDDNKEIVTDHITGLQWADDVNASSIKMQWLTDENYDICIHDTSDPACYDTSSDTEDPNDDTATEYCNALSLDGGGWRLPTVVELQSIVVYGAYNPSIDTAVFENYSTSDYYWSSTTLAGYTSYVWIVDFDYGYTGDGSKDYNRYVRCVRSGQ